MENISYAQMRILETAKSFRILNNIYSKAGTDDVVGAQLLETAQLLEEISGVGIKGCIIDDNKERLVKKILLENGIRTESVTFFSRKDNRIEMSVMARTVRHKCVDADDMAIAVGEAIGKVMKPVKGGRRVVTDRLCEFIFEEAPVFFSLFGAMAVSKEKNVKSGDSYTWVDNQSGRTVICISDGMGTGNDARRTSNRVVSLTEQLTQAGFSDKTTAKLINSSMASCNEDNPFTFDMASVDMITGQCKMVKLGAAASYIKSEDGVRIIKPSSLPAGVLDGVEPDITDTVIKGGDYIVMVSDGMADALPFYDKEQHLAMIIDEIKDSNPQRIAESIMEEIMYYQGKKYKDDMTVVVAGFFESGNSST